MNRSIFFLLLIIFMPNVLTAQVRPAENKAVAKQPASTIGIKKKSSPATVVEKKSTTKNPAPVSMDIHKTQPNQATVNPAEREKAAQASEAIRIDYKNMPADVQSKINNNKAKGKYLLEGIAKSFTVEIKTCLTDADQKKALSFLKTKKGFIHSQFVSAGVVKIIVEPTFESSDLKETMVAEGIHFNFLNRSYLLKN